MNKKIVIAIDGHSSCGKSTFAKSIAAKYGYIFIDTGAMYRAVTLFAMRNNLTDSPMKLISLLPSINITFRFNAERGASDIYLNGENVEAEIRGIAVSDFVSRISSIAEVRAYLVRLQQLMGQDRGIVMDGRDIGTVVFPDAELKIFMTADVDVRAQRRFKELTAKGDDVSLEEIAANIRKRDHEDETRKTSPLTRAADAITLDNSHMSVEQQMQWVDSLILKLI